MVDGWAGGTDDFLVLHALNTGEVASVPIAGQVGVGLMKQTVEVHRALLRGSIGGMNLDEVCTSDDVL